MEEQKNKPSKEEVDALFKTVDESNQNTINNVQENAVDKISAQDRILDPSIDSDTAELLDSFQRLKEVTPELKTNNPFVESFTSPAPSNTPLDDMVNILPDDVVPDVDVEETPQESQTPPEEDNIDTNPEPLDNNNVDDSPTNQEPPVEENNIDTNQETPENNTDDASETNKAPEEDLSNIDLDLDTPIEFTEEPEENSADTLDDTNFDEDFTDNRSPLSENNDDLPDLEQIFNTQENDNFDINDDDTPLDNNADESFADTDIPQQDDNNFDINDDDTPLDNNADESFADTDIPQQDDNNFDINDDDTPLDNNADESFADTDIPQQDDNNFDINDDDTPLDNNADESFADTDIPQQDDNNFDINDDDTPLDNNADESFADTDIPQQDDNNFDINDDDTPLDNNADESFADTDIPQQDDNNFDINDDDTPLDNNADESFADTESQDVSFDNNTSDFDLDGLEDTDFNFDDPNTDNMDLKLEDITDIGNSFYSPSSFEQQIHEENQSIINNNVDDDLAISVAHDDELKISNLKNNLMSLPTPLALHIKRIFDETDNDDILSSKIREELEKENFNIHKIEKMTQYSATSKKPSKTRFLTVILGTFILISGGIFAGIYLNSRTANNLLQHGLDLINEGRIDEGNQIFLNNEPSVKWYNAYTQALIEQGDYRLAEIKLFGDDIKQKGVLDIEPKNKDARMNLARLFMKEGLYDKALSPDAQFNGKNAKSLSYLQIVYPDDFKVLDLVGQTRIGWAETTADKKIKEEQINLAYSLYLGLNKTYPNNPTVLSRLLEISLISNNPKIQDQIRMLSGKGILDILEQDTLAKIGNYYLDKDSIGQATPFFNTLKIRNMKSPKKKYSPLAYYFIGKFYLMSGDLKSSENNLILAIYGNTHRDTQGNTLSIKDTALQGHISNALGRIYMTLLQQYNNDNDFNKKNRSNYTQLALYHLQESKKYNPQDPMNSYLMGEMAYTIDKDYSKAITYYKEAETLLKEDNKEIPIDLSFNYGNSLYHKQEYNQAIEILSNLRADSPLYYPALEYLLGMAYLKTGVYSQAVDKMNRALEFYTPELQKIQQKGYSGNVNDDKILYFASVINNNLGVIYQREGERMNNSSMKTQARTYFYNALEYSKRMNPNTTLSYPNINLQSSLFEGNLNMTNTSNIQGRSPLLYEYTPNSVWEFK